MKTLIASIVYLCIILIFAFRRCIKGKYVQSIDAMGMVLLLDMSMLLLIFKELDNTQVAIASLSMLVASKFAWEYADNRRSIVASILTGIIAMIMFFVALAKM